MNTELVSEQAKAALQSVLRSGEETLRGIVESQASVLARYQPVFTSEYLPRITENEFRDFLRFEHNRHWTLQRQGSLICADMPQLRQALSLLLDESQPIEDRLEQAASAPGLGRAVLTAILLVAHPEKYGVWNSTSQRALETLGVWPHFDRGEAFGKRYVKVNEVFHRLCAAVGVDLWTLDAAFWAMERVRDDTTDRQGLRERELKRRMSLWQRVRERGDSESAAPRLLTELGIHRGEQGIYRDVQATAGLTSDGQGVTVSVLHTGKEYPDDLGEDSLIYHYPSTARPDASDRGEIEATKAAGSLKLPLFVITPSVSGAQARRVRLGWVEGWDDESAVFLIAFNKALPNALLTAPAEDEPFELVDGRPPLAASVLVRPGQERFKFRVLQQYGPRCAVCGIDVPELLEAAHVRPRHAHGSDDPRNGLILCASHHRAFDAGLFAIHPGDLELRYRPSGPNRDELRTVFPSLTHLRRRPHPDAIAWQWEHWRSRWRSG